MKGAVSADSGIDPTRSALDLSAHDNCKAAGAATLGLKRCGSVGYSLKFVWSRTVLRAAAYSRELLEANDI